MKTLMLYTLLLASAAMADECNMTPPYYTYLGMCYQGNPYIQISNPANPAPW